MGGRDLSIFRIVVRRMTACLLMREGDTPGQGHCLSRAVLSILGARLDM
jgi:hypothetical protein